MSYTKNMNLPEMPSGAIEWVAIFNDLIAKMEAGRTLKIIAAEALTAGKVIGIPNAAGKVSKIDNTGDFLGIVKSTSIAQDAEGYAYVSLGNEISVGSDWTVGGLVYVHTVAGELSQTKPTPQAIPIAYANTTTSIVLLRPIIDDRSLPLALYFMQSDVAASQTGIAIPVAGAERLSSGAVSNTEIVMAKPGSITGISIAANAARSGGTLTVDVTINGTVTGLQAILDGTNTQYHYATQARRLDTFSAGDRIGVKITTDGAWAPDTADIMVNVIAEI